MTQCILEQVNFSFKDLSKLHLVQKHNWNLSWLQKFLYFIIFICIVPTPLIFIGSLILYDIFLISD